VNAISVRSDGKILIRGNFTREKAFRQLMPIAITRIDFSIARVGAG
jgi:hypothetical protein